MGLICHREWLKLEARTIMGLICHREWPKLEAGEAMEAIPLLLIFIASEPEFSYPSCRIVAEDFVPCSCYSAICSE
jgi:hypothetical protein